MTKEELDDFYKSDFYRSTIFKGKWALGLIESEIPIPEDFRSDFYDELVSKDLTYRKELEEAIRKHGVRWG